MKAKEFVIWLIVGAFGAEATIQFTLGHINWGLLFLVVAFWLALDNWPEKGACA